MQREPLTVGVGAGRNRDLRPDLRDRPAVPGGDAQTLGGSRLRVPRDQLEALREGRHGRKGAPPVVDGRRTREDRLPARGDERRHPVGSGVARAAAGRRPALERVEGREGVRRRVSEERVVVRKAGLAREDDRVVVVAVAEAAAADEVDAAKAHQVGRDPAGGRIRPGHARKGARAGLRAEGGRARAGGDDRGDPDQRGRADDPVLSHRVPLLRAGQGSVGGERKASVRSLSRLCNLAPPCTPARAAPRPTPRSARSAVPGG